MNFSLELPKASRRAWFSRPDPVRVAARVQAVPLLNVQRATETLNDQLRAVNNSSCGARRRAQCLAPFLAPLEHLNHVMVNSLVDATSPFPDELLLRVIDVGELWWRLAIGYLCVLRDARRGNTLILETAALSALRALSRFILVHYHCYEPAPNGAWRAIHECRAAAPSVPAGIAGDNTELGIAYKQILILGGTGVQRLRPYEQATLYRVLSRWAGLVSVQPLGVLRPAGPALIFTPRDDKAPELCEDEQFPDTPGLKAIESEPLAQRARLHLRELETHPRRLQESDGGLAPDTLRAISSIWSGAPQRRFPRVSASRPMQLLWGLEATWATLENAAPPAPISAQLLEHSATGLGVLLQFPPSGPIRVGEVALTRGDASESWTLGVVRWLRHEHDREWLVGVQYLSREPQAAMLRRERDDGQRTQVLYLAANRAADTPPTLLTPRFVSAETGEYVLSTHAAETTLTLTRFVEATGSFLQYRFTQRSDAEHP